jgi:hypothetical protein
MGTRPKRSKQKPPSARISIKGPLRKNLTLILEHFNIPVETWSGAVELSIALLAQIIIDDKKKKAAANAQHTEGSTENTNASNGSDTDSTPSTGVPAPSVQPSGDSVQSGATS